MKEDLLNKNYEILMCYGFDDQAIIWIEEMSELTKELTKILRYGFPITGYDNFKKEITDVQISLDQMKKAINYSIEEQEKNYKYKVERQLDRMSKE